MDEASFFIRNLRALPWQRAAVWLVVVIAASKLSDFFGVRLFSRMSALQRVKAVAVPLMWHRVYMLV